MHNFLRILQNIINNSIEGKDYDINTIIARFLLANINPPLFDLDIETLAFECFTSTSTVSRFCRRYGFSSFSEMKKAYLDIYNIGQELFLDNESNLVFDSKNDKQTLNNYIDLTNDALLDFGDQVNFEIIEDLCRDIHDFDEVIIYGIMLPGAFIHHFQYMLLSIGKKVLFYPTNNLQYESITYVSEESLIIVVSTDGNLILKHDKLIRKIHNLKAKKILITQNTTLKRSTSFNQVIQLGNYKHPKVGRYKLQLFFEVLVNKYYQLYVQD